MKTQEEKKAAVLEMGRDKVPVAEISKAVSINRKKVMEWLESAGIDPIMLRRRSKSTGSVRNTPLALRLEEGVRERIREREEQERREARKKAKK